VWLYYYSDFPIVRISGGICRSWTTKVAGANALAVDGDRALLLGDHQGRGLGRVMELGTKGEASVARTVALVDERDASLAEETAWGAGRMLYFFRDGQVLVANEW
jgi:hypothetical protein